jgi:hypothetical protein
VRAGVGWQRITGKTVNRGVVELAMASTHSGRPGTWVGAAGQLWEVRSEAR